MNIDNLLQFLPPFPNEIISIAILVLRIIWGIVLLVYGLPMIKNPLHWMDLATPPDMPKIPSLLQVIGALTIFGGALAIMVGLLTPLAAIGLTSAMAFALILHLLEGVPMVKQPPDAPGKSYEASLVYLAIAILFIFLGAGRFSLDYIIFG